jgi:RND family efflux transporter MFP subunit
MIKTSALLWPKEKNLLIGILLISGCIFLGACNDSTTSADGQVRTVLVANVKASAGQTDTLYPGKLIASKRATLSFEASGVLSSISVDFGDKFVAGDKLATLDDSRLRINLKSKQAELTTAEVNLTEARLEYDRKLKMRASGAISQGDLDQAKAKLDNSIAMKAFANAGIEAVERQLEDLTLTAPFPGEVAVRLAEPSQVISYGQPIFEVLGLNLGLEGVIHIPAVSRNQLNISTNTLALVRVLPSDIFYEASIIQIGNRANEAGLIPVTIKTKLSLKNANAGQSIEVSIQGVPSHSLNIPVTAYGLTPEGKAFVFVVSDNKANKKIIEVGRITKDGVEVLSGLSEGDEIVLKGVDLLSDGQQVIRIKNSNQRFGY